MTPLSQKILESYQIRKTKKQKQAFLELLQAHFPHLQVQEGGLIKCKNIIVGDVEKAEVILSAHYDTCAALPLPNFITPKRPFLTILYSLLLVIPFFAVLILVNWGLALISSYFWANYFLSLCIYFGLLALLIVGPANKHTANDNTSGVITLCELLQQLPEPLLEKTAFVFFDHEETGLIGSHLFRKTYKPLLNQKLLINFDCVSDGDHLLLAATKEARQIYGDAFEQAFLSKGNKTVMIDALEKVYYPSDHAGFPVALAAAALKRNKVIGYYMDRIHTYRDTVFDEENITLLCDGVRALLENNNGTDTAEVL